MKLKIKESSWSGWTKDYVPKEVEKEYDIKLNEKYVIKTRLYNHQEGDKWVDEEREEFSFDITEINDSSIKIQTYQPFSDSEKGINLSSDKKEFIVTTEKPLELVTPTMDEGDVFILSLIK